MPVATEGDIRGSYRLVRRLGAGGTGEVWVGKHVVTDGLAAVKLFRARKAREAHRLLFVREGAIIARLSHPHIVRLFELGDEHIATQLVEGSDLGRRLRSGVDVASARRIALQIGSALAYAHGRGVIHRDVKPGNILVDRNGNAFLGDFGMATLPEDHPAQAVRGGTPGFMAPEQARGETVGPPADQYSFARTLLEILVGGSDGADVDDALAMLPPPAAPLAELLRVASRSAPDARFRNMDELVARLHDVALPEVAPAVRLASERRLLSPYAWAASAHRVDEPAPAIGRADFRLSDLEARALLPADACAKFRAETGYADFGWTLYARTDRLGPIGPSTLARASELVVMLHGWACTRSVWHELALAVFRDNADALVLVPDVHGFGESQMPDATADQMRPKALGSAKLYWLSLLGLRDLPGALVGHSMSGLSISMLAPAQLGPRLARVAITPAFMEVVPWARFMMRMGWWLLLAAGRSKLARGLVGRILGLQAFSAPGVSREDRLMMARNVVTAPMRTLALLAHNILSTRLSPASLRGVELVFGEKDPMQPPRAQKKLVAQFGGDRDRVHHMGSGGHFPHMPFVDHPEWTARNQDELVRIIGAVLLSSTEGAVASTLAI